MAKIMDPILLYSLFWDIGPLFWAPLEVQDSCTGRSAARRTPCEFLRPTTEDLAMKAVLHAALPIRSYLFQAR